MNPRTFRFPAATALLAFLAVAAFFLPRWTELLQYDRARIAAGEVWRLATCHATHWSGDNLFWDAATFILLGAITEVRWPRWFLGCLFLSGAAISAAIWLVQPEIRTYRGLSGIDSALFTLVLTGEIRHGILMGQRRRLLAAGFLAVAFTAKTTVEVVGGSTVFVDSAAAGFMPVPLAHAIGGLIGGAIGAIAGAPAARSAHLLADPLEQLLRPPDPVRLAELAPFVLDAHPASVAGVEDDLHHPPEVGVDLVPLRIEVV